MENVRPERIPRRLRTKLEQAGLEIERHFQIKTPPFSYYLVTQLVYNFLGQTTDYFHFSLCKEKHQSYSYRHAPSDQFMRMASLCMECGVCPSEVVEHAHPPGQPCTIRCDSRLVYRPKNQLITCCGHNCIAHVGAFPIFYSRQVLFPDEYPEKMPYSPFFQRREDFRRSKKIAKQCTKAADKQVQLETARKTLIGRYLAIIEPEALALLFAE